MTQQEIVALIQKAVNEVAPGKGANVDPNNLKMPIQEAGVDSVASMEMVAVIEEEIGVNFADDELASVQSFADLLALVQKSQG